MRYSKRETLERAAAESRQRLENAEAALKLMNDEAAAAKAAQDEQDALVGGRALWRLRQESWAADPKRELVDKEWLAKVLVNAAERRAFGLPPLPRGDRKGGAGPAPEGKKA